jgi:TolB protein
MNFEIGPLPMPSPLPTRSPPPSRSMSLRRRLPAIVTGPLLAGLLWPAITLAQDDAYRGPPPPSNFDSQAGKQRPPAPPPRGPATQGNYDAGAPPPRAGAGGGATPEGGLRGTVRQGTVAPIPIAIPEFSSDDGKMGKDVADVVMADLERSGLFQPLDRQSFLDRAADVNAAPNFPNWRQIGAEALAVGRVGQGPDGRLSAEFRLWDPTNGKQLTGQRLATSPQNWRRLGHMIADQIYENMTGEKGYFDTRVVFIDETGPKLKRVKRLAIMDQDGANVRLLSQGGEIVLTPRFSPASNRITYMSYTKDQPKVFLMDLATGQRELVGDFPGMTFAPRFSPDGQRVIMSLQNEGNSAIFEMDLRSRQQRRLTQGTAIDTGPSYSPDGRQIVFESDREGTQQLYVMNSDGSNVQRVSVGDGRYSTPVWSPRGDYIAFTKQYSGRFLIGVMRPDGSGERVLTEGFHNEGPTWAPNGRVLMFFRESQGATGGPRIHSVDLTGYNERVVSTPSFGSDPAWSPLLN